MSGTATGARPYRFLDETSVGNGYVRLRALALLPVILVVLFAVVLGFETGGYGAEEDRDTRDMAWDYRSTVYQSTAFHKYPRGVLAVLPRARGERGGVRRSRRRRRGRARWCSRPRPPRRRASASWRCPAWPRSARAQGRERRWRAQPRHGRGIWAAGNGRAFHQNRRRRKRRFALGRRRGVPNAAADAANLSSYKSTRLAELQEMRTRSAATVLSAAVAAANGLACASTARRARVGPWDQTQWDAWATLAFTNLASTDCSSAVDVCSQTAAALAQAAAEADAVGNVAVRVVTGAWAASNVHLHDRARRTAASRPVTVANADGAGVLSAAANGAAAYDPMTDVAFGEGTAYVPRVRGHHRGHRGVERRRGRAPRRVRAPRGDFGTRYYGLRGGAMVGGARADQAVVRDVGDVAHIASRTWRPSSTSNCGRGRARARTPGSTRRSRQTRACT